MNQPSIVIVDYGIGNVHSVSSAILSLDYRRVKISKHAKDILDADVLVLPGVGAFEACIKNLCAYHLDEILNESVLVLQKPILGICVGMQLMADISEENGFHTGLGWIPGRVVKLDLPKPYLVPHVGWNNVRIIQSSPLFSSIDKDCHFYFDHSYYYQCDQRYVTAACDYSHLVTASISHKNIYGVQFHPEKSHTNGLKLFRSFFNAVGQC